MAVAAAILLIYVLIRAYTLSFTHDESVSFTLVEGNSTWIDTANNHKLNTELMAASKTLFGNSEFSLRLPNVLAFVLYLIGCFYVIRRSKNNWLFLLGLTMILFNPFLIEFFSLARGYGLSLAFMLMSIYFLIKKTDYYLAPSMFIKDFILTLVFASLALYSNLAMANFYISVLLIFTYKYLNVRKLNPKKIGFDIKFFTVFLVSFIPLYYGIVRLFILKEAKQLYFGAFSFTEGFDSLISYSIYFKEYPIWIPSAIKTFVVLSFAIGVFSLIFKRKHDEELFYSGLLIAFIISGLTFEHFFFEARYPIERATLSFVPILAVFIYQLFQYLVQEYKIRRRYYIPVILCIVAPLLVNFFVGSNFVYATSWLYDAHTKDAMKIVRDYTKNRDSKTSISNDWLLEPTINYYIHIWKMNLVAADRKGVDLNSEFIYRLDNAPLPDNFEELYVYDDIKSSLFVKTETDK